MLVSEKLHNIDTLLLHTTDRKYHMACRFVPLLMTLKVTDLLQCFSNATQRTFVQHYTWFQLTDHVTQSLGDSWASCLGWRANQQCQKLKEQALSQLHGNEGVLYADVPSKDRIVPKILPTVLVKTTWALNIIFVLNQLMVTQRLLTKANFLQKAVYLTSKFMWRATTFFFLMDVGVFSATESPW